MDSVTKQFYQITGYLSFNLNHHEWWGDSSKEKLPKVTRGRILEKNQAQKGTHHNLGDTR